MRAAAGTTAADGRGRNSPYTAALLTYLEQPLELSALFRRVRAQVLEATDGEQRPHEYGSLLTEHYLGGASGPGTVTVADGLSATVRAQQENLFWESIVNSTNAADFEEYLRQFPTGIYRGLATNRLGVLRAGAADAPANRPAVDRPERREAGAVFRDCATCPELVVIPAGRFRMGCVSGRDCQDNEVPVHEVEVPSFALGVYEVTFEEYDRFAQATRRDRPSDGSGGRGGRPVDQRVVGGRDDVRGVALGGDGRGVPAAERVGVGVRGAGGDDDALHLGRRHRAQPGQLRRRLSRPFERAGADGVLRSERVGPARCARQREGVGGGLLA